ncbi:MAG TPA: indolepyruvate oxidoreductase subunit beta [bacterium]|nr:indolepyruvate oxidoreductase subunit beta [bacterium]HPN32191.1 indolepyruvate oxidoreductase subunit beta [bacterium]
MNEKKITNVLVCGVGGQGIILASKLLSETALNSGLDVKQSEVHGMSQRGGSVVSYIRFGENVNSPLISLGDADFIVSFEKIETARYLDYANKKTVLIVSDIELSPPSVNSGKFRYPENIEKLFELKNLTFHILSISKLIDKVGNPKTVNTIMLGALSGFLSFPEDLWKKTIKETLPEKILDVNLKAFDAGRNFCNI